MCLLEEINFYDKLIIGTVGPIVILSALGLSYRGAMRWHRGTNKSAIECRQQAKVRHSSAALLVLFLVGTKLGFLGVNEPILRNSFYRVHLIVVSVLDLDDKVSIKMNALHIVCVNTINLVTLIVVVLQRTGLAMQPPLSPRLLPRKGYQRVA